jgi:Domain of unknown function (DUF4333)
VVSGTRVTCSGDKEKTVLRRAFAASTLLLLTACGATEVDVPALEDDIVKQVKAQADADVTAQCPDQVDWEAGKSFTCDVEFDDGSTREVDVKMLDDDGQLEWNLAPAEE